MSAGLQQPTTITNESWLKPSGAGLSQFLVLAFFKYHVTDLVMIDEVLVYKILRVSRPLS